MGTPSLPTYVTEVKPMPGVLTVEEAATVLGRSPARVRQMIANCNFRIVYTLGNRPVYLLCQDEVLSMVGGMTTPSNV